MGHATSDDTLPRLVIPRDAPRVAIKSSVGRAREMALAVAELDRHRLVTLKGPGGVGKTHLAQQVAVRVEDRYADGVVTLPLATVAANEADLEGALLRRFGLLNNNPSANGTVLLMELLRERELLLVLDNAEHLVVPAEPGVAAPLPGLVGTLLGAAPRLHVLVTSQFRLGLGGAEFVLEVPPLSWTARRDGSLPEAVQLLRDRLALHKKSLETEEDFRLAARLCDKVAGVALGIELAAGLADGMTLAEIVEELDHPMEVLVSEHAEQAAHRSLYTAMATTYGLLDEQHRRLWVVLSCFPDTFDVEAAAAVAEGSGVPVRTMRLALADLVHGSVLRQREERGRSWYDMLAPIRQFGAVVDPELVERARAAHADHFAAVAARAAREWYGPGEVPWMYLLDTYMPSVRAAVAWRLEHGQEQQALELALALCSTRYFTFAGVLNEARRLLETCLAAQGDRVSVASACALALGAWTALIQGKQAIAADLLERAEEHLARLGDVETPMLVEYAQGAYSFISEPDLARARMSVTVLHQLAVRTNDPMVWLFAGIDAAFHANSHLAYEIARAHLADAEAHGAQWVISWALWTLSMVEHRHGDPEQAWGLLQRALSMQVRMGDTWGPAWTLWSMAVVAADAGNHATAARLFGGAWERQKRTDVSVDGLQPWLRVQTAAVAACVTALGRRRYEVESAQGRMGMSYEEVVALALGLPSPSSRPGTPDVLPGGLTEREYELVRLLGDNPDLTNRDLTALMGIELRSVEDLVTRARRKTGVGRREFGAWLAAQEQAASPVPAQASNPSAGTVGRDGAGPGAGSGGERAGGETHG
ncbi:NACHT domain-containing protein [Saccharothrix sp. HUAS TT1]|uniref:ATP-binding protein n=1 Tax=unclassified Saccharothrix TaxID=2593673 RepID=UPI00345BB003